MAACLSVLKRKSSLYRRLLYIYTHAHNTLNGKKSSISVNGPELFSMAWPIFRPARFLLPLSKSRIPELIIGL